MQYTVLINQTKALEWGLNAQQAMLFALIYETPSWADPVSVEGKVFYKLSKSKIVAELPLLTDKPDTAYRMLKALELVEVIELSSNPSITLVRITDKGKEWNRSEKNPRYIGKKSEVGSEKNPTDHITSNQVTSNHESASADGSVPLQKILALYNDVCGGRLTKALTMTGARERNIKACWKYKVNGKPVFQSAGFWKAYFEHCLKNPHWLGQNDRGWTASLEFITRKDVMERTVESLLIEMGVGSDAA